MEILDILEEHMGGTIILNELTVSQARLVLAIQGPESPVFNKRCKETNLMVKDFHYRAVKLEYYWTSLTFIMSNGIFLFTNLYFIFSMQGLFQSPVFYSVHLLDVIQRFPPMQTVVRSVTANIG